MRATVAGVAALLALAGCAAPYDDDGENAPNGPLTPAVATAQDATRVVVDTDLGGDDLVALAFLIRHPEVRVEAITVAGTGLVGCDPGVDVVADLFAALDAEPVTVACGRERPGPGGQAYPEEWRALAASGPGIPRAEDSWEASPTAAPALISRLTRETDDLTIVALGPMTNLADLAEQDPKAYARLAGVHAMGGSVDGPAIDGVAEWNVAADPEAFADVLAADAPLTVVPEDAIPSGTPDALSAPVVADIATAVDLPKWWDLAAAAALVSPDAAEVESGAWAVDPSEPGRLRREADGAVRVVRHLDGELMDAEYRRAFGTG